MDKKVCVGITGGEVVGILRGYDIFLNLTLSECVKNGVEIGTCVVRGNTVVSVEVLG